MLNQRYLALLLAACATTATACDDDDDFIGSATLLVVNESDFVITDIFLTQVDNPDFGPNLLGSDVLFPGEDLLLGVECDFYDALVIDEDGVECRLFNLDLCLNDATWVIGNTTCGVFGSVGS